MIHMKEALKTLREITTDIEVGESQILLSNDTAGIACLVVTQYGRLCEVNHVAAQMLGYLPYELEGRQLQQLLDEEADDLQHQPVESLNRWLSAPLQDEMFVLRGRSGRRMPLQMYAHRLKNRQGELSDRLVLLWAEPEHTSAEVPYARRTREELSHLTNQLMAAQEVERKRLARAVHNSVSQALTMIKFSLEEAQRALDAKQEAHARAKLKSSLDMVKQAIDDSHSVAQDLWPSALDTLGLVPACRALCRQFMDANPQVQLTKDFFIHEDEVPDTLRVDVYRVLQECLRNVEQHAKARKVRVIMRVNSEGLLLTVKDDGAGFDADRLYYGPACLLGIGLRGMRERVETHRGELNVQSRPSDGTSISALWRLHSPYATEPKADAVAERVREDLPTLSRLMPRLGAQALQGGSAKRQLDETPIQRLR